MKKSRSTFLLASLKLLTYFEILFSNTLQRLCSDHVTLRMRTGSRRCSWKLSRKPAVIRTLEKIYQLSEKQWRNSTNGREEKVEWNSDAASGTIFRIVNVFKEASRKFPFIFFFIKVAKNLKTVKKRSATFPSSAGMSLTELSGNNLIIPVRESLVSDIPAGTLFYSVRK